MPTILRILTDAMRRLTGAGAMDNAACEVDQVVCAMADVDAQLGRVADSSPRRAA